MTNSSEGFYNKTYQQIFTHLVSKHVGPGKLNIWEAEKLHKKWKKIAAEVQHPPMR